MQLDEFDFKIIWLMKHSCWLPNGVNKQDFLNLWKDEYAEVKTLRYLLEYLLQKNENWRWFTFQKFCDHLMPRYQFFVETEPYYPFQIFGSKSDIVDVMFSAVSSILALTDANKFPGYKEWIERCRKK